MNSERFYYELDEPDINAIVGGWVVYTSIVALVHLKVKAPKEIKTFVLLYGTMLVCLLSYLRKNSLGMPEKRIGRPLLALQIIIFSSLTYLQILKDSVQK